MRSWCEDREQEEEERGGLPFVQAAWVLVSRLGSHWLRAVSQSDSIVFLLSWRVSQILAVG